MSKPIILLLCVWQRSPNALQAHVVYTALPASHNDGVRCQRDGIFAEARPGLILVQHEM
jgi:hypothetical protein